MTPPMFASLLITARFKDEILATATGFLATYDNRTLLITNRHVVTGIHQDTGMILSGTCAVPDNLTIRFPTKELRWHTLVVNLLDKAGNCTWVEDPIMKEKADYVGISVPSSFVFDGLGYPLDTPPHLKSGLDSHPRHLPIELRLPSRVYVIGYPFKISDDNGFPICTSGTTASHPRATYDGKPAFLIDCRTRRGQSGSPVLGYYESGEYIPLSPGGDVIATVLSSPRWRLLGIYSGRVNSDSDLGLVWKSAALRSLFRTAP